MKKIYLIAVVIALAAGVATYFFANELKTSSIVTGVDDATVLIALEDIEENTVLKAEMFQTVKMPITAVSFGTVCNADDIIGYMSTEKIYKGEQLMARKLAEVGNGVPQNRLSYELSNGTYAYSIYVKEENAVSFFLKEYDYVNVYSTLPPVQTEPLLQNVQVLRISDYNSNVLQESGTEIMSYTLITLALTKEQIPKLMSIDAADAGGSPENYRIVLVSHAESNGIADDLANVSIPEERNEVPQTNYGMGEISAVPSTTKTN